MATKRPVDQEAMNKALEDFVKVTPDAASVNEVSQSIQLHVTGTQAYITSYTRQVMDENHGAPVMAVHTKTIASSKRVFIYPAADPDDKTARKLRGDATMGPAYFAFGVPLRTLKLRFPISRRVVLPLNTLEVPDQGTVYWASFADIEKQTRNIDTAETAMPRKAQKKAAAAPEQ